MSAKHPPPQPPVEGCLSDLVFDGLVAGELEAAAVREARSHLGTCPRCAARLAAVEEGVRAFAARHSDLAPLLERRRPHSRLGRPALLLAPAAAAAALILWLALPWRGGGDGADASGSPPRTSSGATQLKGSPALSFFVSHQGEVRRGAPGERVQPGDELRFTVSLPEPSFVAVLSVDGAGQVSVYFPDGPAMARREATAEDALPLATRLDAVLGPERLLGFFCARPVALARLREVAAAAPLGSLPGCRVERIDILKVAL